MVTGVDYDRVFSAEKNFIKSRWTVVVDGKGCVELVRFDNLWVVLNHGHVCVVEFEKELDHVC